MTKNERLIADAIANEHDCEIITVGGNETVRRRDQKPMDGDTIMTLLQEFMTAGLNVTGWFVG